MRRPHRDLRTVLALVLLLASAGASAAALHNSATGTVNGVTLDLAGATVTLQRNGNAVSSAVAEITPDAAPAAVAAQSFTLDLRAHIGNGDSGFDTITVTAPNGWSILDASALSIDGVALSAACPAPTAGRYCAVSAGTGVTVTLGTRVVSDGAHLQITLSADSAPQPGSADFAVAVDDAATAAIAAQAASAGDADGDPDDANTLTVTLTAVAVDALQSQLTVDPPIVLADGVAQSVITVRLRDAAGHPIAGREVTLTSDRGALDALTQPLGPTNSSGVAHGRISSTYVGVATISAVTVLGNVELHDHPTVTFTRGIVLDLAKLAPEQRFVVGDAVGYRIELRNLTATPVDSVTVVDDAAPVLKYLEGSARLDGMPIPDPQRDGNGLRFTLGTIAALSDSNGNGRADPGEPGYSVLSYRMVVGAGARPGEYSNNAAAIDVCASCTISNRDEAAIEVTLDPTMDLGTIIGKVYRDHDGNGRQDAGDEGIAQARVVLDDGTYALTDEHGRYHFPAVQPGQRLVKLDAGSLGGVARRRGVRPQVLSITPGLMAKANFAVDYDYTELGTGPHDAAGARIDAYSTLQPVRVTGSTTGMSALVNDTLVPLPQSDVSLRVLTLDEAVRVAGDALGEPMRFDLAAAARGVRAWRLSVRDAEGRLVYERAGQGAPPAQLLWDGHQSDGQLVRGGAIYQYQLLVEYEDGSHSASPRRLFGVDRRAALDLDLTGGAFESGSDVLTGAAKALLRDTAAGIREMPREQVVIAGHTDSVGSDTSNDALSLRRARSALAYLVEVEGLPRDQFVVLGYGEHMPIADNATPAGRALNRRVEIRGELSRVDRTTVDEQLQTPPEVRINGAAVALGSDGRFATDVEPGPDGELALELTAAQARAARTSVHVPSLDFAAAGAPLRLPYGTPAADGALPPAGALVVRGPDGPRAQYLLRGGTEPGNVVEIDGESVAVSADGAFSTVVALVNGDNVYGVVARNPAGYARIANVRLSLSDRDGDGPVVVLEPTPTLVLRLPPDGAPISQAHLLVPGFTDPGNAVRINGAPVELAPDGSFNVALELQEGDNELTAEVSDPAGHSGVIEHHIVRGKPPLFLLALADGKLSRIQRSGNLRAANADAPSELKAEGRVAYYLKGTVKGRYLITSAFDSGQSDLDRVFSDLDATDNSRLLTNLDPDTLYPVYSDSSTVVYDAQSQGKFYVALESATLSARVGNYPLELSDTELARYQRTLYGAQLAYRSARHSGDGTPRTRGQLFAADVRQAHVHDELQATGGALYYLSQRHVIEGSEQVALVVRDGATGLTLSRVPQTRGEDYTVKYEEGRLLFRRPITSTLGADALIDSNLLAGHPVYVEIDYETQMDAFAQTASGGRVQQQIGERLAIGATAVSDEQVASHYALQGADAELRLGQRSRLVGELARSEGVEGMRFISRDGGFSFDELAGDASSGDAVKLAAEIDVGEWVGRPDRMKVGAYYKDLAPGFMSNGTASEEGSRKTGLQLSYKLDERNALTLRRDDQSQGDAHDQQSTALWERHGQRTQVAVQLSDRDLPLVPGAPAASDTSAAARVRYDWTGKLATSIEHEYTLHGTDSSHTTLGVDYELLEHMGLEARATTGARGDAVEFGAHVDYDKQRMYLNERAVTDERGVASRATVIGAETAMGEKGTAYTEYQFGRFTDGIRNQTLLGVRRRWSITDGLNLITAGEHTELVASPANSSRDALALGVEYATAWGLKASSYNELRRQSGGASLRQMLTSNQLELALRGGFSLLGKYRYSDTEDPTISGRTGRFLEASVGAAYRPVDDDRLNLLARYTHLRDDPTFAQDPTDALRSEADVLSADWIYAFTPRLEWVGKEAYRIKDHMPVDAPAFATHTHLSVQRLNVNAYMDVALGVEYRRLSQREAQDARAGWLTELMWQKLDHLRAGVGYNFTDFSDDLTQLNDYTEQGWFLRLQGIY